MGEPFDKVVNIGPLDDDTIRKLAYKVTDDKQYVEKLVYMAQGNPGAMTVITEMHQKHDGLAPFYLGIAMAYGIQGPMLWLLYKDICGQNISKVFDMLKSDAEEAPKALAALHYSGFRWPK